MAVPERPTGEAARRWRPTVGLAWRAAQVRLRFVAVLLSAFVVVGKWEAIRNHAETVARRVAGASGLAEQQAVSTDTEYFCPMDPGVVSDWPGKCGVCNMALVRRKRGEAAPGPDGVIARMQFSPYRVQLAGLRTAPASYRALGREVTAVGEVDDRHGGTAVVKAAFFERDLPLVAEGQSVAVSGDVLPPGQPPLVGKIVQLGPGASAFLRVDDPEGWLRVGATVTARARVPISASEPFRSLPTDPPPLRPGEPRVLYACPEHPDARREAPGRCPKDRNDLELQPLADNQRVRWWCPMHPKVVADRPGATCPECGGMTLLPRVVTYNPPGQVLSVPESAVIDTGTRAVVYVERMPGMFDAVEVSVGPRCGGFYPVASGLEPGERVATSGAFLIDAETRLNPSLAASYFGASGRSASDVEAPAPTTLPAEDRAVIARQKVCPVTGKPLGSMGPPLRVEVGGRAVWICCEGCEDRLRKDPGRYLKAP